jgi:hypothetical protein
VSTNDCALSNNSYSQLSFIVRTFIYLITFLYENMVVYKFLEISDAFKLFWNHFFPRIINNCQRRVSNLFALSVILSCLIIHV